VRKLPAVEALGSATVIASDKTGTLTRNEMTVRAIVTASGRVDVTGIGYSPDGELQQDGHPLQAGVLRTEVTYTLSAADRANNAVLQNRTADGQHDPGQRHWAIQGDPTEGALIVAARKAGLNAEVLERRFVRVGEVPFSSERKLMSTVHTDAERPEYLMVFSKGAPDVLLNRCYQVWVGDVSQPLTEAHRVHVKTMNEQLAGEALRTLGVASRSVHRDAVQNWDGCSDILENELVFLGLVGMIDPPRDEVKQAVAVAKGAGIRPIMITGDHPKTAAAIAAELGIAPSNRNATIATAQSVLSPSRTVLSGAELDQLSDEQLTEIVRH
jgi:Ca2+-transporting ATPase